MLWEQQTTSFVRIDNNILNKRTHLGISESWEIGSQVEGDAFGCARKRHSANEQHRQKEVREEGREVNHLCLYVCASFNNWDKTYLLTNWPCPSIWRLSKCKSSTWTKRQPKSPPTPSEVHQCPPNRRRSWELDVCKTHSIKFLLN